MDERTKLYSNLPSLSPGKAGRNGEFLQGYIEKENWGLESWGEVCAQGLGEPTG